MLGREFELSVLADVLGVDEDALLDDLELARAAGLLHDVDADRARFAHALVRQTVYDALPPARRARLHAAAAAALEARDREVSRDQRIAEVARHWLAAGDRHAGSAWRSARDAAAAAERVHAHEEAGDLLAEALRAAAADPSATSRDRYDLLMSRITACHRAGDIASLTAAVDQAIEVARALGDRELEANAAIAPTQGAAWQARPYGVVHWPIVQALRRVLAVLPPEDSAVRCRLMLSLAAELYYGASPLERDALCEQAVAMARRLGDPSLLAAACQTAFSAVWRPATTRLRLALADESVRGARAAGDQAMEAMALVLRAVARQELGELAAMWRDLEAARAIAEPLRLSYALLVLEVLEAPGHAMAGRFAEAGAALQRLAAIVERTSLHQAHEAFAGYAMTVQFCTGQGELVSADVRAMRSASPLPLLAVSLAFTARYEGADAARAVEPSGDVTAQVIDELDRDDWMSLLIWCCACEVGFRLADRALAAAAYERAAPYAGLMACGGSGAQIGPVDAFLAYAAAGTGAAEVARRHAADAAVLCEKWQIPPIAAWWRDERDRHGF